MQVLSAVRCPFCRDELELAPHVACGRCATGHHVECFVANGGCTVLGCRSLPQTRRIRVSAPVPAPRRANPWGIAAIALGIFAAIALGMAANFRTVACEHALEETRANMETKRANERFAAEAIERICEAERILLNQLPPDCPVKVASLKDLVESGFVGPGVLDGARGYVFTVSALFGSSEYLVSAVPRSPGVTGDASFFRAFGVTSDTRLLPSCVIPVGK
jgi:hypothetical protein